MPTARMLCFVAGIIFSSGISFRAATTALPAPEPSSDRPGFHRLDAAATGLTFQHTIPASRHLTNQMLLDGAGVALGDVDGDGRIDIFFAATGGGSQLWRNEGHWRFQEVTSTAFPASAGLLPRDVTGAALADLDGDGSLDLVLNSHSDGIRVLLNDGHGRFHSLIFPQSTALGGHSVALADVDGDGWVDIYVCNYRQRALMDMPNARATFSGTGTSRIVATVDGRPTTAPDLTNRFVVNAAGGLEELGEVDVLYRNHGGTNFTEVSWTGGAFLDENGRPLAAPPRDWGLAAQFCDVNGDGRPDLYVCNDFQSPDRFWINEGSPGTVRFRSIPSPSVRHTSLFSMGVDFGDINRDGRPDFVVVDMLSPDHVRRLTMLDGTPSVPMNAADPMARPQSDANTLFLQRGDGSFADVAGFAGVTATDWSWTPAFLDVDLDGWLDLLVTAGQERGSRDLDGAEHMKAFRRAGLRTDAQIFRERLKFPRLPARLQAFRNRGASSVGGIPTYEDAGTVWGLDFYGVSHGLALGDLDGDGDLDLVVNHLNEPAGLYRNDAPGARVAVRLKGSTPNTSAVGACLRFGWGEDPADELRRHPQSAQIAAGGRYLSSDDFAHTFACPGPGRGMLEVRWPSGRWTVLTNLMANQRWDLEEPATEPVSNKPAASAIASPLRFEARVTSVMSSASSVDDFGRQPLLPRRQSTRTPVAVWADPRGSSNVLWLGGASGQALREVSVVSGTVAGVRTLGPAVPSEALAARSDELLVAELTREGAAVGESCLFRVDTTTGVRQPIAGAVTAPASLALSGSLSVDGTWLFVGGGGLPGRYPQSSPSQILKWVRGGFVSNQVTDLGLVTASVFTDLNHDGRPELVTVSEWGSPRILRETESGWNSWDAPVAVSGGSPLKVSDLRGWWQSLVVDDFDGDGRPDIVLGNWGLNSAYALYGGSPRSPGGVVRPLFLYHGGGLDPASGACLEAYTGTDGELRPIHSRMELASYLPWVVESFPTHRSFAEATLSRILGDRLAGTERLECRWMASVILLNRGERFEMRQLPDEAQLGPILAMASADFDGDGRRDLYCAQGYFGHNFGVVREDAGEGVFLLSRDDGQFAAIPSAETGVRLLGEQRSVLAGDLDGDGRPDLLIGVHGGPLTLLLNRRP